MAKKNANQATPGTDQDDAEKLAQASAGQQSDSDEPLDDLDPGAAAPGGDDLDDDTTDLDQDDAPGEAAAAPASQPDESAAPVQRAKAKTVAVTVLPGKTLRLGEDEYGPGARVKLPAAEAERLKAHGFVTNAREVSGPVIDGPSILTTGPQVREG